MRGQALGDFAGAEFRRGIDVPLSPDYKVDILEVSKQPTGVR